MRSDRDRVLDMLEAIAAVERYAARGEAAFRDDELVNVWIIHHLQVLGEAAARVTPAFREAHPAIPWPGVVALRNLLVHEYFGVDPGEVWTTVVRDLPPLRDALGEALPGGE